MTKKVCFSDNIEVRHIYVWKFAHKEARKRYWEFVALDSLRFKHRIMKTDLILSKILESEHRNNIFVSRFST